MAKLTWRQFIDRHPIGHLLVGVVPEAETPASGNWHLNLMAKLLAQLAKGQYALTMNRQHGALEVHCLFDEESDTKKIGDAVGARASRGDSPSGSQRSFKLDAGTCQIILQALELPHGRSATRLGDRAAPLLRRWSKRARINPAE